MPRMQMYRQPNPAIKGNISEKRILQRTAIQRKLEFPSEQIKARHKIDRDLHFYQNFSQIPLFEVDQATLQKKKSNSIDRQGVGEYSGVQREVRTKVMSRHTGSRIRKYPQTASEQCTPPSVVQKMDWRANLNPEQQPYYPGVYPHQSGQYPQQHGQQPFYFPGGYPPPYMIPQYPPQNIPVMGGYPPPYMIPQYPPQNVPLMGGYPLPYNIPQNQQLIGQQPQPQQPEDLIINCLDDQQVLALLNTHSEKVKYDESSPLTLWASDNFQGINVEYFIKVVGQANSQRLFKVHVKWLDNRTSSGSPNSISLKKPQNGSYPNVTSSSSKLYSLLENWGRDKLPGTKNINVSGKYVFNCQLTDITLNKNWVQLLKDNMCTRPSEVPDNLIRLVLSKEKDAEQIGQELAAKAPNPEALLKRLQALELWEVSQWLLTYSSGSTPLWKKGKSLNELKRLVRDVNTKKEVSGKIKEVLSKLLDDLQTLDMEKLKLKIWHQQLEEIYKVQADPNLLKVIHEIEAHLLEYPN